VIGEPRAAVQSQLRKTNNRKTANHHHIMSLKLSDAKSQGAIAPAGNHIARCYSVVDLGTHTEDGAYGVKTNRKIRISWELPDELHQFREEKGEEPFAVHKTYNFTMGEKSTMRKDLEAWRGKPFTAEEMNSFELKNLLGTACMVNVTHAEKKNATYANVDGVTAIPKALKDTVKAKTQHNASVYYEVDMGQGKEFEQLPDWMKEMIAKCREWNAVRSLGGEPNTDADDIPMGDSTDDDNSCPF